MLRALHTTILTVAILVATGLLVRSYNLATQSWMSIRHPEVVAPGPISVIYADHLTEKEKAAAFVTARQPYIAQQRQYGKHQMVVAALTACAAAIIVVLCYLLRRKDKQSDV